jgi:hypothetical protein
LATPSLPEPATAPLAEVRALLHAVLLKLDGLERRVQTLEQCLAPPP